MLPVIYDDRFLEHDTGSFHPERPQRLEAIVEALKAAPWGSKIAWQVPTSTQVRDVIPWLYRAHAVDYVHRVEGIAVRGGGMLDLDTPVSSESYEVALLAVNAWLDGVDRVLSSNEPAFILARPPGHHAKRETGMGFCLFSNAAIAALYGLEQVGVERVAIFDWDVHHGNGTQSIVEGNPKIIYCSLHQSPCYPGTGFANEKGISENVLNIPMKPGGTLADYQVQLEKQVLPFFQKFQPDLIIVSAGYDANRDDPLAGMALLPEDYRLFTDEILTVSRRVVFGLEGGYDLKSLAASVLATIEGCLGI